MNRIYYTKLFCIHITVGASGGIVNARSSWSGILKSLRIQTVVMVIDSSDHERINHAKVALAQFSEENKTTNIQLLILANKQVNDNN